MSVRLSELAKDLGTTKKELLEKLPALGFELKKSQVEIDEQKAVEIKDALRKSGVHFEPQPKRPTPVRAAKPAAPKPAVRKPLAKPDKSAAHAAQPAPQKRPIETPSPAASTVRRAGPAVTPPPVPPTVAVQPPVSSVARSTSPRSAAEVGGASLPSPLPVTGDAPPPATASAASALATPPATPSPAAESLPVAPTPTRPYISPLPRQAYESPRPLRPPPQRQPPPPPRPPAIPPPVVPAAPAGQDASRPVPEMPRTTPRAPRPTSPRATGPSRGGHARRPGTITTVGSSGEARTGLASEPPPPPAVPLRPATLSEGVTVKEFSEKLNLKSRDVITKLMQRGTFATINQRLDKDIALQIGRDFGFDVKVVSFEEESALEEVATERPEDLAPRPPVVTVMGHVDHGKTTLLDAIREANVAGQEAGQITQHIGAYQVEKKGRKITFLDTPGHEAFTMMRARGAKATDIVVLVVAADDGVMPQTVEAIHHAKAAQVPIIVAVNKIDVPNANPDRVLQMLVEHGLQAEEWGGDTVTVKISAKKRQNLDALLDLVLLVADLQELKANPKRSASGVVLEAKLDRGRGPVATVLVQGGTLRAGDPFIAGAVYGKVRAMFDDLGEKIEQAPPATPVEVLGLAGVPRAGDAFQVVSEDWRARQIGSFRQEKLRESSLAKSTRRTLDQLYKQIADGQLRELLIVLKGDVQGSVEALTDMLQKLSTEKVRVRIIHSGTGAISETDVLLASASNAIVIGFNVRPDRKARELAEQEVVDVRLHTIIYHVTTEIKAAMQGLLEPTFKETVIGRAEVRQMFRVPKVGTVAGCMVIDGRIARDSQVRLLRDNVIVYEGKLQSLRRFKEDASEVRQGFECGLSIANYPDVKEGDVVEAFKLEEIAAAAL